VDLLGLWRLQLSIDGTSGLVAQDLTLADLFGSQVLLIRSFADLVDLGLSEFAIMNGASMQVWADRPRLQFLERLNTVIALLIDALEHAVATNLLQL